jgi:hypothetical protein
VSGALPAQAGDRPSAISVSPYDLWGEGVATVLDRCREVGLGGISLASVYHAGRDVFPHNPRRRVRFLDADAAFFVPEPSRYGAIRPRPGTDVAAEGDALALAREQTAARDMTLSAWLVVCHNEELAAAHPEHVMRNAFGDPYQTALCPSSPLVREYAAALVSDVLRYDCDALVVEAVHFAGFTHGYHHERSFAVRSEDVEEVLGACFCRHCAAVAGDAGIELAPLAAEAARWLDRALNAATPLEAGGEAWWPEFEAFLAARAAAVTALLGEVDAARSGSDTRVIVVDDSASVARTAPTRRSPLEIARRAGFDFGALAGTIDGVTLPAGYAPGADLLKATVEAHRDALGGIDLQVSLRPLSPGCDSAETLALQLRTAFEAGAAGAGFYHYGFLPSAVLGWIREALASVRIL